MFSSAADCPNSPSTPTPKPPTPSLAVAGLRDDGKTPAAFIADTTTANAQVRARR